MKSKTIIVAVLAVAFVFAGLTVIPADQSDAVEGTGLDSTTMETYLSNEQYSLTGGTYYLNDNLTLSKPIVITDTVTIDLNGKTLTSSGAQTILITSGSLTIGDSSNTDTGKIANTNTAEKSGYPVYNQGGTLNINGGAFDGKFGFFSAGGTTNVNDGSFVGSSVAAIVSGNAVLSIYGGSFKAPTAAQAQNGGTMNISGGTFESTSLALVGLTNPSSGSVSVNVTGGTFHSTAHGVLLQGGGSESDKVSLSLSGNATVTADNGFGISGNGTYDYADITISGGTVTGNNAAGIYFPQIGNLTISGGTIEGTTGVQYCGAGTISISGGTLIGNYEAVDQPYKPADQGDGSIDDGSALSIVSRGGGYQDPNAAINEITVNITGGNFISENNSAIWSYRTVKGTDGWAFNDDASNIDNAVDAVDISGGNFESAEGRPSINYDKSVETGKYQVSGGTFSGNLDESLIAPSVDFAVNPDGSIGVGADIVKDEPSNPSYDDDDLPPFIPTQPKDSGDDVTIVACAAAAVVAALMAVFLIVSYKKE